jgi:hypothetical protein
MRNIIHIFPASLLALILINGCRDVATKTKLSHMIYFYYRIDGRNGEYLSYTDNLVYSNYENGVITANDLFPIAKQYIDTVKADAPVGAVNFVGLREDESLPKSGWNNKFQQRKYFVIEFIFSNSLQKFAGLPIRLIGIIIWKNEKANYFYHPAQVDSVLNSPRALNNV